MSLVKQKSTCEDRPLVYNLYPESKPSLFGWIYVISVLAISNMTQSTKSTDRVDIIKSGINLQVGKPQENVNVKLKQ